MKIPRASLTLVAGMVLSLGATNGQTFQSNNANAKDTIDPVQEVLLKGDAGGKRFDGIGVVNGGGATAILLKDYPVRQRSEILDLLYKPKFGASVSALLVEIPGDGNSTQGSMPSHMHTRDDLNYGRGYIWWILQEARRRNPDITLDGTAWSAPGWVGDGVFWSRDAVNYYVNWLKGLKRVYGLELDAMGCRNEKGENFEFPQMLRKALDSSGFQQVKIHGFDNWPKGKFDFVAKMLGNEGLRNAIDIISAHVLYDGSPASPEVQRLAAEMQKPIWNTEDHVYKKGFDALISIVACFNQNFIQSGATKIINWYDIAALYPMEPYSEEPATVLAYQPWSGHYRIREALWGYAHYGQFSKVGWQYLNGGCGPLAGGGTMVTLKSPGGDYSVIMETKDAKAPQRIHFQIGGGLADGRLCVWKSDAKAQFIRQKDIIPTQNGYWVTLQPHTVYSLSTTAGQQKGRFHDIPAAQSFPFPYFESFDEYAHPAAWGYLPHFTADIAGAFELKERPDKTGMCLRQAVPERTISWAPDWLPYTILGDKSWTDYEISADLFLNTGDSGGVMGRINDVGSGYGFIPKGYFFQLSSAGLCQLFVVRGKVDKNKAIGDAEQQAMIKANKDESVGGEKLLGRFQLPSFDKKNWHNLKIRFEGTTITALVDGRSVIKVVDDLYSHGMAGLIAGGGKKRISRPYYDNLSINAVGARPPAPTQAGFQQRPIYPSADK